RIAGQAVVEDGVADLVSHLVRMAHGYGFAREQVSFGHVKVPRLRKKTGRQTLGDYRGKAGLHATTSAPERGTSVGWLRGRTAPAQGHDTGRGCGAAERPID